MSYERPIFQDLAARNVRKSYMLLGASVLLLWVVVSSVAFLGFGVSPIPSLVVAGVLCTFYMLFAIRSSKRVALRMAGAEKAGPEYQRLVNLVEGMAIAAGLPVPEVWVIHDPAPNAFAAGYKPENSVIAVTDGLLALMNRNELEGVIAHEMGHIRNRDIAVTTISVVTVSALLLLADLLIRIGFLTGGRRSRERNQVGLALGLLGLAILVVGVPLALVLKAALSRSRERLADNTAVELTRNPSGIRAALEKLEADPQEIQRVGAGMNSMWIESPADKSKGMTKMLAGIMDTHPPIGERIEELRAIEGLPPGERGPYSRQGLSE